MTVKQLIKLLEKIEDKNLKVELAFWDWRFYNFSKVKDVYDNSPYTKTVRITND